MGALHTIFMHLPWIAGGAALLGLAALAFGLPRQRVRQLLLGALIALLALHAIVFLHTALAYVSFPYEQKSVVEGVTLYNAVNYLEGELPYRDPTQAPMSSMVYPPVHELALAGVMAILGGPSLTGARMFSLLCVLAACFVSGLAVWRRTRNWPLTLFAGAFFVCGYGLSKQWLEQVRNDALLVFLVVLGLLLATRAMARKKMPVASLVVLLLALYTKQTAVFAAVAVVAALWMQNRKRAIIWGVVYGGVALLVLVFVDVWTRGWFIFYVIKQPASVGIEWSQINHAITFLIITAAATVATVVMCARLLRPSRTEQPGFVWALAFALGSPLCLLQSLKWGADMNAFLPLLPLMGILTALALHRLLEKKEGHGWAWALVLGVMLMQVGFLHYPPLLPNETHHQSHARLARWVRTAENDVLVSGFASHTYMNGKRFWGEPVLMSEMEKAGTWKGGAVIDKVRAGSFSLLILRPQVEPRHLAEAVAKMYVPVERIRFQNHIGGWPWLQVYVPRERPWRLAEE